MQRAFTATAPDQLWMADLTYCRTFVGWVYAALIVEVSLPPSPGLAIVAELRTDLAFTNLEMGLWT